MVNHRDTETQRLAILLALAPACYICIAIYLYSVDFPQIDEWALAPLHQKFAHGTLSLGDLFWQLNEYRQFFPNLIFVTVGYLTKGDLRLVMYLSFILACVISYNVFKLTAATTLPITTAQRWWLLAAANALIFSPIPVENWLQGQQLIYYIPAAALTTCLRIAYSDNSWPRLKLVCCGLLCIVSTFSSANGFICWLLMLPALLHAPLWITLRHKLLYWLAGFVLCLGLYLRGFHRPATSPALTHVLAHPVQDTLYWLSLLGRSFNFGRIVLSIAIGALLLGLYLWAVVTYLRRRRSDPDLTRGILCWLILGGYSISTGLIITIARAGWGLQQSLSTRYATFTLMLPVALIYLLAPGVRRLRIAIVTLILVVHIPIYIFGIRNMRAMQLQVLHDKACIQLLNVVADECQARLHPDLTQFRTFVNTMDQLGYLRPPLAKSRVVQDLAATDALSPEHYGSFVELKPTGAYEYTASGTARLPRAPAHAVLLACESSNQIIGVAEVIDKSAQWSKAFDSRTLPSDACTMTAWAFDVYTGKAFKISGAHTVAK